MEPANRNEPLYEELGGGQRSKWLNGDSARISSSHGSRRSDNSPLRHNQQSRRSEGIQEIGIVPDEIQGKLIKPKAVRPIGTQTPGYVHQRGIRKHKSELHGGGSDSRDNKEDCDVSQVKSSSVDNELGTQKQGVRRSVRFRTDGGLPSPLPVRTSGVGNAAENVNTKGSSPESRKEINVSKLSTQHLKQRHYTPQGQHQLDSQNKGISHCDKHHQKSELTQQDKRYDPVGHEQDSESLEVSYIGEGNCFDQVKLFIDEDELTAPEEKSSSVVVGRLQVVKDDKAHKRPGVNKLPWSYWQQGNWAQGFPDETLTMESNDISPGFAIRKIALLFENHRYLECTNLIRRLSHITLKTIVSELPVDVLIEALPQSIQILDALYAKFFLADPDGFPSQFLLPEKVVSHLVRWIASIEARHKNKNNSQVDNLDYFLPYCQNIMRVVAYVHPKIRKKLKGKRKGLNKCVQGLSQHGLVDTSETKLMNLNDALKIEFNKMIQQLKGAITQLESGSYSFRLPMRSSITKGRAPAGASHQRMMQMNQREVQERLIKNKSLMNVVEPALSNSYLAGLIHILETRINSDKDVLFHFAELRKEVGELPQSTVIVPLFQEYAFAHSKLLGVIREVTDNLDTCGFSSEEDDDADCAYRYMGSFSSTGTSGKIPNSFHYFFIFFILRVKRK